MLKTTLQFFALGALLFIGRAAVVRYSDADLVPINVSVAAEAGRAQIDQAIQDEIMIDQAFQMGWHENDPIARQHMVRNMRFVDADNGSKKKDSELLAEAIAIGMPFSDSIVRARLIQRSELALERVRDDQKPTKSQLQEYLSKNGETFTQLGRIQYTHVFLSGEKRNENLRADADTLKSTLNAASDLSPQQAHALGDPLLRARATEFRNRKNAESAYGKAFADAMFAAKLGEWVGPIESVFGMHLIRVNERSADAVPSLSVLENQVRGKFLHELKRQNFKERYANLREQYDVNIISEK